MNKLLIDTSVWINVFKGNYTNASNYLRNSLANTLIATCPVIVQKVLQGLNTDADFIKLKQFFEELLCLKNDPYQLSIEAASLYRSLRKEGITIRKPNDCLIAAYAIKNNLALLHDDKDFEYIAAGSSLKTIKF